MKRIDLLGRIVVRMIEHEVGEDDEDALLAVPAELVVAVQRSRVGLRVVGRRERSVLDHVAAEYPVARRTCTKRIDFSRYSTSSKAAKRLQTELRSQVKS